MKSRKDHLAWCKAAALEYLNQSGDVAGAVASMTFDMSKHPDTALAGKTLMALGMLYVMQHDEAGARRWIEGFRCTQSRLYISMSMENHEQP